MSAGTALAPSAAIADDGTANIAPIVCVDSKQGCLKYLKASSSASKLVTKTLTCRPGDMRCRTRLLGLVEDAAATRDAERVFEEWLDRYRELDTLEGQLADVAAELGLDEAGLTELLARFDLPKQPGSLKTRLLGALAAWGLQGGRGTGDARADMKNMLRGLAAAAAQDRLRMPFGAAADYSENGITWIDSAWGQWGYTSNDVSGQPGFFAFTVTPGTATSGTINVMEPIWVFGDPKSEGGDAGTGGTDAGSGTRRHRLRHGDGTEAPTPAQGLAPARDRRRHRDGRHGRRDGYGHGWRHRSDATARRHGARRLRRHDAPRHGRRAAGELQRRDVGHVHEPRSLGWRRLRRRRELRCHGPSI